MNHLPLIIKREYLTKVKNKSFIIMTFITPIVFITLLALVTYLSQLNTDMVRSVYVLDASHFVHKSFKNTKHFHYKILNGISLKDAKVIVQEADAYGLLYISGFHSKNLSQKEITFYSEDLPSLNLISELERQLESSFFNLQLQRNGIDSNLINAANVKVNIDQESFTGEKTSKVDGIVKLVFGCALGYLLFMFIIIYGNMTMRSVIEEKTSRIIEVIISSVKPIQLMFGKIIGTALAGVTQFAIWIILGGVLIIVLSYVFGVNISGTQTPQQEVIKQVLVNSSVNIEIHNLWIAFNNLPLANLMVAFLLFFIGGYLLYSSFYAAVGAAVDSETDTQQFILPIITPLVLAVYIGIFTVIEDPHGSVSTVFSFIPLTAPVVMLIRIPFGVPIWQQILSLLILVLTFVCALWVASKIYRVGILMYGKKPSYKTLIKWIKY